MQDSSLLKQLDKASAQLKRLSDRASVAEANAKALKAKNKATLQQKVDATQASTRQASDDLKACAKETQGEITQWWGQVQENWKSHIARVRKNAEQDMDVDVHSLIYPLVSLYRLCLSFISRTSIEEDTLDHRPRRCC